MIRVFIVLVGVFLVGCSSQQLKEPPYSFETISRLSEEQWQKHRYDEEYVTFNTEWLLFNNSNYIDQRGGCYALSDRTEDLILVQNTLGVIQYVVAENENEKTDCFKKVFLDQKYPVPPFAPFYHYMRMERN